MTTVNVCRQWKRAWVFDLAGVIAVWFVVSLLALVVFLVVRPAGMTWTDQIGWSGISGLLFMFSFVGVLAAQGRREQVRKERIKARVRSRLRERSQAEPKDEDSPHLRDTREALATYFDVSPTEIRTDDDLGQLLENDSLDRKFDRTLEMWVVIQLIQKHQLAVKSFRFAEDRPRTVSELAHACRASLQEAEMWPAR
jgi:hypothetical protein